MKFIYLIAFLICCSIGYAQKEIGINFRMGKSMLRDQNLTGTLNKINSFGVGVGLKIPVNSWNQLNVQLNIESKGAYFHVKDIYFKLYYYSIPVYYGLQFFNEIITVSPGLYFGFSIQSYGFLANTRPRFFYHFNRVDYGFTYLLQLSIFKFKSFRLELLHSLAYGFPSAYNVDNSPIITVGPAYWIRNFTYDIGFGISYKLNK